ncbi:hypothetical protein [Streptomyces sp. NPDC001292]|uniref:hypothetical protein n=1 Tax=Streptomyces sp. NPDC001292 TaxID=3364558 RepID=UPI00368C1BB9
MDELLLRAATPNGGAGITTDVLAQDAKYAVALVVTDLVTEWKMNTVRASYLEPLRIWLPHPCAQRPPWSAPGPQGLPPVNGRAGLACREPATRPRQCRP